MADQSQPAAIFYSTLNEYLKKVGRFTGRDYVVFNRLFRGRKVTFNHEGTQCDWPIEIDLPEVRPYTGGSLDFPESDTIRNLLLPWRGSVCTDAMTELGKLMNRGDAARVRLINQKANRMRKAMQDHMCRDVYIDGVANTGRTHGLLSCLGYTTPAAGDLVAQPNDSYAGSTTNLATYNGSWDANLASPPSAALGYDWPEGDGTTTYDATSPKIVKVNSTGWSSGQTGVADNIEEATSQTISWCTLLGGTENAPNLVMLSPNWYNIYKNVQRAKQTLNIPAQEQQDVGFKFRGFWQDGAFITTEFGMPASSGFVMGPETMELRCMYSQMFMARPPQDDIRMFGTLWLMAFFGNFCISPKYLGYINALA